MITHSSSHLLLDEAICRANIGRMTTKARRLNLHFRPHFKTHQSAKIAQWFRDEGLDSCTVSSLKMAEYFSLHQWNDICISTPVNPLEIEALVELAAKIRLSLTLCDSGTLQSLGKRSKHFAGIYLKTDTGYGRAGIPWYNTASFAQMVEGIKHFGGRFKGFLSHDGHTYAAQSIQEIEAIRKQTNQRLTSLKQIFAPVYPHVIASVGDTPSCSLCNNFDGIDEIRPGNFVFYDLMQWKLQSCGLEDIALQMRCPLISIHQNNHAIIHCGAVHLSKESLEVEGIGKVYGRVMLPGRACEEVAWISSLSQEHGKVTASPEFINSLKVGQMLDIIPVHSCLTAEAMKGYFLSTGGYVEMMKFC